MTLQLHKELHERVTTTNRNYSTAQWRSKKSTSKKTKTYYWWWAYLRRSQAYLQCCAEGGTGPLADLYADFGDVREADFHKWWTAGQRGVNGCPDVTMADFAIDEFVPAEFAKDLDDTVNLDVALQMDWRLFEGLAAALWAKQGFTNVYCTPRSGDNGVDVVALKGNEGVLIQTKSSGIDGYKHGWDTVKEVIAGHAYYQRRHPGVTFQLVGLSNQYFNSHAYENANLNGVMLIGQDELSNLLQRFSVKLADVERFVYAEEQVV